MSIMNETHQIQWGLPKQISNKEILWKQWII